ncbi:MAG: hypothetical protein [Olavius algarvensis Gamma 1 endosymbiont]|nr:MAG: hypothetical protein [Olavius algarvensis Gamma 1 endosymbiont]
MTGFRSPVRARQRRLAAPTHHSDSRRLSSTVWGLETAFVDGLYLANIFKNIELIFIKPPAARGFPDSLSR